MIKAHFIFSTFLILSSCGGSKEKQPAGVLNEIKELKGGKYSVLPLASSVEWLGKELTTKTHTGTLGINSGYVEIDQEKRVKGEVVIDMQTLIVTDLSGRSKEVLEGHLKSDDFFGTNNFPKATLRFHSNGVINEANQIDFQGDLTIKDISNKIDFSATVLDNSENLKALAKMTFDRSKYNVRYRSGTFFDDLGDKLILDDIDVNVLIVAEDN